MQPSRATRPAPTLSNRLDDVLDRAVAESRIVGAVLLVARDGDLVYHRAVGQADREAARPMTERTILRLASLTKPVTSVIALALAASGIVDLDAPVTRWLPDFRPRLPGGSAPPITLRHLLTHTSGLGYGFFDDERPIYEPAAISSGLDQPGLSFDENARRLASVPLFSAPGAGFRYSLSTDILGEALARAAGTTLGALVDRLVTRPLGMSDTAFYPVDPTRLAASYADGAPPVRMPDSGYLLVFPGGATAFAPGRALDRRSYQSGGSGLTGTAADFLRFLEALRLSDVRLLDSASFASMKQNQVANRASLIPIPGPGWSFGNGLAILEDPVAAGSPMSAGTLRWEGAYGSTFFIDPAQRLSVVALTNTGVEGMSGRLPTEIQRAIYASLA
jgi:CubicO group peptidase (beta-lactamase class C family)